VKNLRRTATQAVTWRWLEEELVKRLIAKSNANRLKPLASVIERELKFKARKRGSKRDVRQS
jgi:hypothetical protein